MGARRHGEGKGALPPCPVTRLVDEIFMHYFYNPTGAPSLDPLGNFRPQTPNLPKILREPMVSMWHMCDTSTSDKHQNTFQTVFPQFLQPVADIDLGLLAQRLTFCHQTFVTLLIRVHSGNNSRMYFLIVLTTDYCWRSWTSRIQISR